MAEAADDGLEIRVPLPGRVLATRLYTSAQRALREVSYVCLECDRPWVRYTAERIVQAGACPFCGGRSRIETTETKGRQG